MVYYRETRRKELQRLVAWCGGEFMQVTPDLAFCRIDGTRYCLWDNVVRCVPEYEIFDPFHSASDAFCLQRHVRCLGKQDAYLRHLKALLPEPTSSESLEWLIASATPAERTRAILEMLHEDDCLRDMQAASKSKN
jgi:hypothetical protein